MDRQVRPASSRRAWWAAALIVPLTLAACGSGSGSGGGSSSSADARLKAAGEKVAQQMTAYQATAQECSSKTSPVVCLETADRVLGGQVHDYANLLATGRGFTVPQADLSTARNAAQTLANSLEILGDAQPTQANYNQVQNTFNVNSAIDQLRQAVGKADAASA